MCAEKNNFKVEFSIKDLNKPIGVAKYKLTKQLPDKYKGKLPSANEIRKQIKRKYGVNFDNKI